MCESKLYSWTCTSLPKVFWTISYMPSSEYLFNCGGHVKKKKKRNLSLQRCNLPVSRESPPPLKKKKKKRLPGTISMNSMKVIEQDQRYLEPHHCTLTLAPPFSINRMSSFHWEETERLTGRTVLNSCLCRGGVTWDQLKLSDNFSKLFRRKPKRGGQWSCPHGTHTSSFRDSIISMEGPEALPISAHHWHDGP